MIYDQIPVGGVGDAGKGIVPRQEGGEETAPAASLDAAQHGGTAGVLEVADAEQQESQVEPEEEHEEHEGRPQGAGEEDRGEDPPSLSL
jgi:hypothetical protein